jgi:hypothetical protein
VHAQEERPGQQTEADQQQGRPRVRPYRQRVEEDDAVLAPRHQLDQVHVQAREQDAGGDARTGEHRGQPAGPLDARGAHEGDRAQQGRQGGQRDVARSGPERVHGRLDVEVLPRGQAEHAQQRAQPRQQRDGEARAQQVRGRQPPPRQPPERARGEQRDGEQQRVEAHQPRLGGLLFQPGLLVRDQGRRHEVVDDDLPAGSLGGPRRAAEVQPDLLESGHRRDLGPEAAAWGKQVIEGEQRDRDLLALSGRPCGEQDAMRREVEDIDPLRPGRDAGEVQARVGVEGAAGPDARAVVPVDDRHAVDALLGDDALGRAEERARCGGVEAAQPGGRALDARAPVGEALPEQRLRARELFLGIRRAAGGERPNEQGERGCAERPLLHRVLVTLSPASSGRTSRSSCRGSSAASPAARPCA